MCNTFLQAIEHTSYCSNAPLQRLKLPAELNYKRRKSGALFGVVCVWESGFHQASHPKESPCGKKERKLQTSQQSTKGKPMGIYVSNLYGSLGSLTPCSYSIINHTLILTFVVHQ